MPDVIDKFTKNDIQYEIFSDGDILITHGSQYFVIDQDTIKKLSIKSNSPERETDVIVQIPNDSKVKKKIKPLEGTGAWECKFIHEGTCLGKYIYASRSFARNGQLNHKIGTHGRIDPDPENIPASVPTSTLKKKVNKNNLTGRWECVFHKNGIAQATHIYTSRNAARNAEIENQIGENQRLL